MDQWREIQKESLGIDNESEEFIMHELYECTSSSRDFLEKREFILLFRREQHGEQRESGRLGNNN